MALQIQSAASLGAQAVTFELKVGKMLFGYFSLQVAPTNFDFASV